MIIINSFLKQSHHLDNLRFLWILINRLKHIKLVFVQYAPFTLIHHLEYCLTKVIFMI